MGKIHLLKIKFKKQVRKEAVKVYSVFDSSVVCTSAINQPVCLCICLFVVLFCFLQDTALDPGEDVALLSVSFEDAEATQVFPKLYLSPSIEQYVLYIFTHFHLLCSFNENYFALKLPMGKYLRSINYTVILLNIFKNSQADAVNNGNVSNGHLMIADQKTPVSKTTQKTRSYMPLGKE